MYLERETNNMQENQIADAVSIIHAGREIDFPGFFKAVEVTPEMAENLLKHNTKNRHISDVVNLRYAKAMHAGHWQFNGEPIVFSDRGRLLDGQNRLKAIVRSGVTVPMLIVYGVEERSFNTMDQGSKRTTGQILGVLNHKDSNILAATLRLAFIYTHIDGKMAQHGTDAIYNDVLLNFLIRYPNIKDSVRKARPAKKLCSSTITAFCHFAFSLKNPKDADAFIRQVALGTELSAGHPALIFRNLLIEKPDLPPRTLIALFFKAWNHFRKDEKIKALKWRETDVFPEVI